MATENRYKMDVSFFPDGIIMIEYGKSGTWGTDPFTDNDKRYIIDIVKTLEYTADGKGNYYNLSLLSSMITEGTGTVEGEIWLTTMLHGMDVDTFKSIEEWRTVGQDSIISID